MDIKSYAFSVKKFIIIYLSEFGNGGLVQSLAKNNKRKENGITDGIDWNEVHVAVSILQS